jgi:hypothetical protein
VLHPGAGAEHLEACEWLLGVDAERRSLEDVAKPLTAEEAAGAGSTA